MGKRYAGNSVKSQRMENTTRAQAKGGKGRTGNKRDRREVISLISDRSTIDQGGRDSQDIHTS